MHKLVHMVNFNTSVQALTLLFQILDSRDSVNDRWATGLDPRSAAFSSPATAGWSTVSLIYIGLFISHVYLTFTHS
jgi:hypothetical protein